MVKILPGEDDASSVKSGANSSFNLDGLTGGDVTSASMGSKTSGTHMITNGLCSFSPTSTKGKWIFMIQTIILSFTPIVILLVQNGSSFYDLMIEKEEILHKNGLVVESMGLSRFIMALQWERAAVSLSVFLDRKSGKTTDLTKEYSNTDTALREVNWRAFGPQKVFENPLRFQIRIDDFRKKVTNINKEMNTSSGGSGVIGTMSGQEALEFYNLATGTLLTGLEKDLGSAQSSSNWKILMAYFNMIQCLESAGIGLVYGLRFYSVGQLLEGDLIHYLRTHALMYEYYRQAAEIVPPEIGKALYRLFTSDAYKIVNSSTVQILENVQIDSDDAKGRKYFEGSVKFMKTLNEVLNMLIFSVKQLAADRLHESFIAQVWGVSTLCVVLIICPLLAVLSKNAIGSIQIFALSVERKSEDMRKQKKKQEKLIYKMLPKIIVERVLQGGEQVAETFDQATLYFSSVDGFNEVSRNCNALQVVKFLNKLYLTMDKRMDNHDVYKVETISDQYLVVSGVPKKNGDKHAAEICNMALELKAACGSVVRPDIAPRTITIQAGIHTGKIVAGVVGSKMPRYCLFGDTINTTSRMQSSGEANKIQISKTTWLLLSMKGGFMMEERGMIEVKGKGEMQTYWLLDAVRKDKKEEKKA